MLRIAILVFCGCLFCGALFSRQLPPVSAEGVRSSTLYEQIRLWLALGETDLAGDKYQEAQQHFSQAYEAAKAGKITELELESLISLAYTACLVNQYEAASRQLNQAQELLNQVADTTGEWASRLRFTQGYFYQLRQDYPQALSLFEESLCYREAGSPPDDPEIARILNFAGQVYRAMGENEKATDNHQRALHIQQKRLAHDHLELARTYLYLGICAYQAGDNAEAKLYYEEALRIRREKLGEKHRLVASVYNNLGLLHWEDGQPREGLAFYTRAVAIYKDLLGPDDIGVATGYNNMGLCYHELKEYQKALHYFREALRIRIARQGKDHPVLAGIYNNIGLTQLEKADYQNALASFRDALRIGEENEGFHHIRVGKYYSNIARVYREMHNPEEALRWHQQSLIHAIGGYADTTACHNPPASVFPISSDFLDILHQKAITQNELPPNFENATCALHTYLSIDSLVDMMRMRYVNEDAKFHLAGSAEKIYSEAITTAHRLYLSSGNDPKYLEIALKCSEKQKSLVLLEALNASRARKFGLLPEKVLAFEKDLRKKQTELKEALFTQNQKSPPDENKITQLSSQLFNASRQYDSLTQVFDTRFPQYFQLKYQYEPPGMATIVEGLPPNTGLVEYYLGGGSLHIFLLTDSLKIWKVTPEPDSIVAQVSAFQESIYQPFRTLSESGASSVTVKTYEKMAVELYQLLLGPIDTFRLPPKLMIIPHGVLGYVPFDALLTDAPAQEGSYRNYPYLIHRYNISRHYSAALLLRHRHERKLQDHLRKAAIFAPLFSPSQTALSPLMYSREETEKIARLTGGEIFKDTAAARSAFLNKAGTYRLIHISSHARVNDISPMFSTIDFASGETVNVLDLFGMELNADLVTLSACETGTGTLVNGEGIMSLARGFMYAGAPSIVNTLWEVNDAATGEIMIRFYESLVENNPKDEALQDAKLRWLRQSDHLTAHPYYWSGIIAVGDMSPVKGNFGVGFLLIILVGTIGIGGLIIFYFFRKK
ncbi:MAG: CHAT domain-containing tetratricopeptide repeat protein [Bacteroidia bacterium]